MGPAIKALEHHIRYDPSSPPPVPHQDAHPGTEAQADFMSEETFRSFFGSTRERATTELIREWKKHATAWPTMQKLRKKPISEFWRAVEKAYPEVSKLGWAAGTRRCPRPIPGDLMVTRGHATAALRPPQPIVAPRCRGTPSTAIQGFSRGE